MKRYERGDCRNKNQSQRIFIGNSDNICFTVIDISMESYLKLLVKFYTPIIYDNDLTLLKKLKDSKE